MPVVIGMRGYAFIDKSKGFSAFLAFSLEASPFDSHGSVRRGLLVFGNVSCLSGQALYGSVAKI